MTKPDILLPLIVASPNCAHWGPVNFFTKNNQLH